MPWDVKVSSVEPGGYRTSIQDTQKEQFLRVYNSSKLMKEEYGQEYCDAGEQSTGRVVVV